MARRAGRVRFEIGRRAPMIYLDHNATAPLRPAARRAIGRLLDEGLGNPSSVHRFGQRAKDAIERAREQIALALGAEPQTIVFTSGGTESNNLALFGRARAARPGGRLVTSTIEHPSVLRAAEALERRGWTVHRVRVGASGVVDPDDVGAALTDDTFLCSVQIANHETGALQPIDEIAARCRRRGIALHADAVQAFGKMPLDCSTLPVDLLSVSAHKIGGPSGSGALVMRRSIALDPLMYGGVQERGLRPGTESLLAIAGFGAAAEELCDAAAMSAEHERIRALTERLGAAILDGDLGAVLNGPQSLGTARLANTLNVSFAGVDGHLLVVALDLEGICASSGSACSSGLNEPSPVVRAMFPDAPDRARGSVRFSLGAENTNEEISRASDTLGAVLARMRLKE